MLSLIFLFLLTIVLGTAAYAGLVAAPWVPTLKKDIERVRSLVEIKPGEVVVDLGCGDGRVMAALAKGSRAHFVGYELSLIPLFVAKLRFALTNQGNCVAIFKNFWNVSLSNADLVYFFLTPNVYARMKQKLERELKPGARVISFVWPIDGWIPTKVDEVRFRSPIYLYQR